MKVMITDKEFDPLGFKGLAPGTRVIVFDYLIYKDDVTTPLSMTLKPATVVCHYGALKEYYSRDLSLGPYSSLIDVRFDHRPEKISKGHFTYGISLEGQPRRVSL